MTRRRKDPISVLVHVLRLGALITLAAWSAAAQDTRQTYVSPLPINETITRQLGIAERHIYLVALEPGAALRLDLTEKGADCVVSFSSLPGDAVKQELNVDFGDGFDRETLTYIAQDKRTYVVAVGADRVGAYSLIATVNPAAGRAEQQRAKAAQSLAEGMKFWSAAGNAGSIELALQKLEGSLKLWQELKEDYWAGYAANVLGKLYFEYGQKQQALEHLKLALRLFRKVGDKAGQALVSSNLGNIYKHFNQHKEALKLFSDALAINKEIRDERGQVATLIAIGVVHLSSGDTQTAISYYERALAILKDVKDAYLESRVRNEIGLLYARSGEVNKALSSLTQALVLARQTGNVNLIAGVSIDLGDFYSQIGEFQQALEYGRQALSLYQKSGDRLGQADVYTNIGEFYLALGEWQEAETHFQKAIAIYKGIGDDHGAADALTKLAQMYRATGNVNSARQSLRDARALLKGKEAENPQLHVDILLQEARIHSDDHDDEAAIRAYREILNISRKVIGYRSYQARALMGLAGLCLQRGDAQSGAEIYTQAFLAISSYTDPEMEAWTLTGLMVSWLMAGQKQLAIFYGKEALNKFQGLRTHIRGLDGETQKTFLRKYADAYVALAHLLLEKGRHAEALQIINAFQDQQFYDFNRDTTAPARQLTLTPREAAFASTHQRICERAITIDRQLEDLQRRAGERPSPAEAQELARLTKQFEIAGKEFYDALVQAATDFSRPARGEDVAGNRVEDLAEMQATLRELSAATAQKTVAIYTLVGAGGLRVLLVTPDSVTAAPIVVADDFDKKVLQYYALLQSPAYDPRPLGKELYDLIVKPIEPALRAAGARTLLWSLGGTLRYVPMASLWDGQHYLVERYQHVVFTRADRGRMTRAASPAWIGVGFGNSRAQSVDLLGNGERFQFPGLPGVMNELRAIFRPDGNDGVVKGEVFSDAAFTKASFFDVAKRHYSLVHVASHFSFRPGDATQSFLLLGDGTALTLHEMKSQGKLFDGVELLTLSACNTAALRANAMGREIDGFAELAQRLGAGAVLATLWTVADNSTPLLMREFYRTRQTDSPLTKAAALQRAQLALLHGAFGSDTQPGVSVAASSCIRSELASTPGGGKKLAFKACGRRAGIVYIEQKDAPPFNADRDKPFAHPYYWAPFILIGNPR